MEWKIQKDEKLNLEIDEMIANIVFSKKIHEKNYETYV